MIGYGWQSFLDKYPGIALCVFFGALMSWTARLSDHTDVRNRERSDD